MTRDTGLLNDIELDIVSGGGGLPLIGGGSTIVLPHIARDKDLLTPAQIAKLLAVDIRLPIPRS
jgi:hypothetical protein